MMLALPDAFKKSEGVANRMINQIIEHVCYERKCKTPTHY